MLGGCASIKPTKSGYLQSYPSGDDLGSKEKLLSRKVEPGALDDIDSFYIAEVVWRSDRPQHIRDDPSKAEPLLTAFREALRAELSKVRPVIDSPGPRTARVRVAVTDLVEANVGLNIMTTIFLAPVTNGGAAVEAEVTRPNGAVLAQIVLADTGGIADFFEYYSSEGHARKTFRKAATLLREVLVAK